MDNTRQLFSVVREAIKRGDDKKLLAAVEQHRWCGFGWRFDGLSDWATDAIFNKLQELGVDVDAARFREQARAAGRCGALCDVWMRTFDARHPEWEEFPFLASEELWRRLTPDLACPELVADRLAAAITRPDDDSTSPDERRRTDLDAALAAVAYLESFPVDERPQRFEELNECDIHDFQGWLLELVLSYGASVPDAATRIADVLSTCCDDDGFQADLTCALAEVGRHDEALKRIRANLEQFPRDVQVRMNAADAYALLGDIPKAWDLCVEALQMATSPLEWDGAKARLSEWHEKLGRQAEFEQIQRQHPRPPYAGEGPAQWAVPASDDLDEPIDSEPPRKPGRNEPCPCGSGRKYKKCCLKHDKR